MLTRCNAAEMAHGYAFEFILGRLVTLHFSRYVEPGLCARLHGPWLGIVCGNRGVMAPSQPKVQRLVILPSQRWPITTRHTCALRLISHGSPSGVFRHYVIFSLLDPPLSERRPTVRHRASPCSVFFLFGDALDKYRCCHCLTQGSFHAGPRSRAPVLPHWMRGSATDADAVCPGAGGRP